MELIAGSEQDAYNVRSAYESFFRAHFDRVARAAALVAGDAGSGQELAQEAFARLYLRWDSIDSDAHARNFAYKVATNLARSHVRKLFRIVPSGLRYADTVAAPAGATTAWLDAVAALGALSSRQRACVVLVDFVDLDAAEVAHALGININTVRVHLMRGRQTMRRSLGLPMKEDDGDEG